MVEAAGRHDDLPFIKQELLGEGYRGPRLHETGSLQHATARLLPACRPPT